MDRASEGKCLFVIVGLFFGCHQNDLLVQRGGIVRFGYVAVFIHLPKDAVAALDRLIEMGARIIR